MIRAMQKSPQPLILALAFVSLAGLAPDAHAYLDPSTGSMILSAVVGLFATIGMAVKTYWYKLRNLVLRRGSPGSPPPPPAPGSGPGPDAARRPPDPTGRAS
jgi:hypothetical protein